MRSFTSIAVSAILTASALGGVATAAQAGPVAVPGPETGAVAGPAAGAVAGPAAPPGFSLTWHDDFDGRAGAGLDTAAWKYDTGPGSTFGTGEIETMTSSPANVFHDGAGHLVLRALHSGNDPRAGWTSGRVETQAATFGAAPGGVVRMESSLQQPNVSKANGVGYWPAFWMLGAPLRSGVTWPKSGEIDILENINGHPSAFGTLHCGVNPGGPCGESTGIGSGERPCPGCGTGYHRYAVEIDRSTSPEQIRWYLDGSEFFSVNSNRVDAATWADAVDHPFYIIYDLAIGGSMPSAFGAGFPNTATASGHQMNIDWVAVWNKGPSAGSPSTGPTDLAQGRPAVASSLENQGYPASQATDGNPKTRWSSRFADPQWISVDLGASRNVHRVVLNWETAYGRAYQLQSSEDGVNWSTFFSTSTSEGHLDDVAVKTKGRYIRMLGTQRGTPYGYSLWNFRVY